MYYKIRDVMGLALYETSGFGYILARANDLLNERKVIGFKILSPHSNSTKRCRFKVVKRVKKEKTRLGRKFYIPTEEFECGKKAVVGVLVEINDKRFMLYLCLTHFRRFLKNMVKYVEYKIDKAYELIAERVSELNPIGDLEDLSIFFKSDK